MSKRIFFLIKDFLIRFNLFLIINLIFQKTFNYTNQQPNYIIFFIVSIYLTYINNKKYPDKYSKKNNKELLINIVTFIINLLILYYLY